MYHLIFVFFDDKVIYFSAQSFDTIDYLKARIQHHSGIPAYQQFLSFQGKHLEKERSLSDYNFQKTTWVNLKRKNPKSKVVTLRGSICKELCRYQWVNLYRKNPKSKVVTLRGSISKELCRYQ